MDDPFKNWPRGSDGEPVSPALLTTDSDFEAYGGLVTSKLESYGIPFFTRCGKNGQVGRVIGGFSAAGLEIYVPQDLLEDAKELLRPVPGAEAEEEEEI